MRLNYHVEHFAEDVQLCCGGLSKQKRSGCSATATQPTAEQGNNDCAQSPFLENRQIATFILQGHLRASQPWRDFAAERVFVRV